MLLKNECMRECLDLLRNTSSSGNEAEFGGKVTHSELLSQL